MKTYGPLSTNRNFRSSCQQGNQSPLRLGMPPDETSSGFVTSKKVKLAWTGREEGICASLELNIFQRDKNDTGWPKKHPFHPCSLALDMPTLNFFSVSIQRQIQRQRQRQRLKQRRGKSDQQLHGWDKATGQKIHYREFFWGHPLAYKRSIYV